jgi:hypothetical protein
VKRFAVVAWRNVMDKLKPILAQKFWILSGLSLVLALVGWFLSKGSLQAAIDTRRTALKAAFDSVKAGGENPNDKWTLQLKTQNELLEKELRVAYEQLYLRQQELKFWPAGISAEAQADPLKATQTDLEVYRARYPEHVEDVRMYIEPANEIEGFGKVHYPTERMERRDWGALPPTPKQMQESQEDLWLYANVFQAIAEINRAASGQTDATLREVVELKLRGGDPDKIGESASGANFGGGPDAAGGMPEAFGAAGMGAGGGGGGGGGAAALGGGKVDFNPDDEFGPDGSGGGGNRGQDMGSMAGMMAGGPDGGGMQPEEAAEVKRYVRESDQWKTRGFYMKAVIDHRKLPDVLAGLTSARWPIRITRVHQVDLLPDDLVDAGAGGGGGMAGMAGGMPAGMAGGGGMGGAAAGPPQISGLNMLTPSSGSGAAGGGLGGGFGGAAPAAAAFAPAIDANPMGSGATETVDTYQAAMNDPDLVVIAIDGLIVMYNPPPVDPNAPVATEPAATEPAATEPGADSAAPAAAADPAAVVGETPAAAPAAEPAAATEAVTPDPGTPDGGGKDGGTPPAAAPPAEPDKAAPEAAPPAATPPKGESPAAPAGEAPASPAPDKP